LIIYVNIDLIGDAWVRPLLLFARKLLSQFPSLNGALPQSPRGVAAFLIARKLLSQFPSPNGGAAPKPPQSGVAAFLLKFWK